MHGSIFNGFYFSIKTANVTVNHANIVESEVFVYNLGTMYYIDDLLYPEVMDSVVKQSDLPTTTALPTTFNAKLSTIAENVEQIPGELFTEQSNIETGKDILVLNERGGGAVDFDSDEEEDDDDEIVTPRALPVQFMIEPPKK